MTNKLNKLLCLLLLSVLLGCDVSPEKKTMSENSLTEANSDGVAIGFIGFLQVYAMMPNLAVGSS